MDAPADIDRLIEEGLNRYGGGDLDGALNSWERALVIDPDNAQANSYVDYVRQNYEVLQTDAGPSLVNGDSGGYGLGEEPEYQIEIVPGEMPAATGAPMYMDPLDAGWFIDDETNEVQAVAAKPFAVAPTRPPKNPTEPPTIEMEADEPPPNEGISFDDETREYPQGQPLQDDADESGGFRAESTPLGFSDQGTALKKRDLGFVKPAAPAAPFAPYAPAPSGELQIPSGELKVRLRTPTSPGQTTTIELGGAGSERAETARTPPPAMGKPTEELSALIPRPPSAPGFTQPRVTPPRGSQMPVSTTPPVIRIPTRDFPEAARPPAGQRAGQVRMDDDLAFSQTATRDMERAPTPPLVNTLGFGLDDPLVTQPTRELGLRPTGRPSSVYPDEDIPTLEADARAFRQRAAAPNLEEAARQAAEYDDDPIAAAPDGTRHDIVLPFDPIDARTAQILDDVDAESQAGESKDDRVRRRITTLLERAVAWNAGNELDKAVAAVDLALSEDPNSALAQKLIHRNRETIMNVFQDFLGNLDRMPALARPLHELGNAPISPRAAFLLSRIDGSLSIDEILDVSGMPRLEAYRHLCQLFLRGILR